MDATYHIPAYYSGHDLCGHVAVPGDSEMLEALEGEAKAARNALSSAGIEETRHLLQTLKMLSSRLSSHGRRARRSAGIIQSAITQAEIRLEDLCDENNTRYAHEHIKKMFEYAVYSVMSGKAKQFFDQIQVSERYAIKPVQSDGVHMISEDTEVIKGEELRHHFSMLEYHALPESEKCSVLMKTFGIERECSESGECGALKAEQEEYREMYHALRDLEAYSAAKHLIRAHGVSKRSFMPVVINHMRFAKAHAEVEAVIVAYDAAMATPQNDDAISTLHLAQKQLKATLRHDIIDGILLHGDTQDYKELAMAVPVLPWMGADISGLLRQ